MRQRHLFFVRAVGKKMPRRVRYRASAALGAVSDLATRNFVSSLVSRAGTEAASYLNKYADRILGKTGKSSEDQTIVEDFRKSVVSTLTYLPYVFVARAASRVNSKFIEFMKECSRRYGAVPTTIGLVLAIIGGKFISWRMLRRIERHKKDTSENKHGEADSHTMYVALKIQQVILEMFDRVVSDFKHALLYT